MDSDIAQQQENTGITDEIKDALKALFNSAINEDLYLRRLGIREWKRNEEYWKGVQHLFWNETANDWTLPNPEDVDDLPRVINIIKAHGSSIVAALTASIPHTRFFPEDADNPNDLSTAEAYSKIEEIIHENNHAKLLLMRSLFVLYNQAFIAGYVYAQSDSRFGTIKLPKIDMVKKDIQIQVCPACGFNYTDASVPFQGQCPQCGQPAQPTPQTTQVEAPEVTSVTVLNKSRIFIDVYGPLNVKIPWFIDSQDKIGYLVLSSEEHVSLINDIYEKELGDSPLAAPGASTDSYDRWGRKGSIGDFDSQQVTVHRVWLRPWYYQTLGRQKLDVIAQLKALFPNGVLVIFAAGEKGSEVFLEAVPENLDNHWEVSFDPLSRFVHTVPLASDIIELQDLKNELTTLSVQCLEHAIPETFLDPDVIDFEAYRSYEKTVGTIFPTKRGALASRRDGQTHFTLQTSTVPDGVQQLAYQFEQDAYFVTGDYPSVFGGPSGGNTRTLGEYSMSRANALQRLGIFWTRVIEWWTVMMKKSCDLFVNTMLEDEKQVKLDNDSYINVWVRTTDVKGKIGNIKSDTGDNFPITAGQKQDLLMRIFELNNPELIQLFMSPENSEFCAQGLGYPEIKVPGHAQRTLQYKEISQLLQGQPQEMPPQTNPMGMPMGPPQLNPSVPIDQDIDDHNAHINALTAFLTSDRGQNEKETNPAGYMNCVAHLRAHKIAGQQMMMQQMMQQMQQQGGPPEGANGPVNPPNQQQGA